MRNGFSSPTGRASDRQFRLVGRGMPAVCLASTLAFSCSNAGSTAGESGGGNNDNAGASGSLAGGADRGGRGAGGSFGGVAGAVSGGVSSNGGYAASGGFSADGGSARAGSSAGGGAMATAGAGAANGGAVSTAGGAAQGGSSSMGGKSGDGAGGNASGGAPAGGTTGMGPCDIYAAASTPCVAAHSTVRALYGAYKGNLYQVRRGSDQTTKDIPVGADGFVDISTQDTFCGGTTCTISILYDQSPNHNDLAKSPKVHWLENGGNEANAADGKATVSGHTVHGIYVTGFSNNVAYRNNAAKGTATGDQPEAMYMVVDGKRYSDQCCFDYGNAETSGEDDGNGTMEAVYWGSDITWGGKGEGSGPWIAADLENGVFKSDKGGWKSESVMTPSAKSVIAPFATAMLKGPSGNHFTLKGGNAQSGALLTMWDSVRPSPGYSPKLLKGAIILGTGGDGSNGGTGTFFEGAITSGNPPDSVDDAIQANIVAAGYGR